MKQLGKYLNGGWCLVFCSVLSFVEVTAARVLPVVDKPSADIDVGLNFEGPLVRRPGSLQDEMDSVQPQYPDSEGSFHPNSEISGWVSMDNRNSNQGSENSKGISESKNGRHDFSSMKPENRCIFCGYADCPVCYYLDDTGECRINIECLTWEQRLNLRNRVKSGDKAVDIVEAFLSEVKDKPISNSELAQMFRPNKAKPSPHFGTSWLKDMYLEIIHNLEDGDATDFEVDTDSLIISTADMTKIENNLKKIAITNTKVIQKQKEQGMMNEKEAGTWENLLDFKSKDMQDALSFDSDRGNSQQISISLQLIAAPLNVDKVYPKLSERDSKAVQNSLNLIYDIIHSYDPQSNSKNDPNSSNNLFENKLLIPDEILKNTPFLGHSIKFPFIRKSDHLSQTDPKFNHPKNEKNTEPFIEERNDNDGIGNSVSKESEFFDVKNIVDHKNTIGYSRNSDKYNNSEIKVVEDSLQDESIDSVGSQDSSFGHDLVHNKSITRLAESLHKNDSSSDIHSSNSDINHPTINGFEESNIESLPSVNSGDIEVKRELVGEISIDILDVENLSSDERVNSISNRNSGDDSDNKLSYSDDSDVMEESGFEYSASVESGYSDSGLNSSVESFLSHIGDTSSSDESGYSELDQTSTDESIYTTTDISISDSYFDTEYSSRDESTYSGMGFDSGYESSHSGMESESENEEFFHSGMESESENEESFHSGMESESENEESSHSGMESDSENEESSHSDMESDSENDESLHSDMQSDSENDEYLPSGIESGSENEETLHSGMVTQSENEQYLYSDTEFGSSSEESLFSDMESSNVDEEYLNSSMESEINNEKSLYSGMESGSGGDEYSSTLLESTITDMTSMSTVKHTVLSDLISEGNGRENKKIVDDIRAHNLEESIASHVFDYIRKLEENVKFALSDSTSLTTNTNLEIIDSSTDTQNDEIISPSDLELINYPPEKLNLTLLENGDSATLDLTIEVDTNDSKEFNVYETESGNYEFHDLLSEISIKKHDIFDSDVTSSDGEDFNFEASTNGVSGNKDSSTNVETSDQVLDYVLSIKNKREVKKVSS